MVQKIDKLRLSPRKVDFDPHTVVGEEVVDIYINNKDVRDFIREIELPFTTKKPELAGAYESLAPDDVFFPNRHFLGEPDNEYLLDEGKVPILRCRCGDIGCGPIYIRITVLKDKVIWSDFENPWNTLKWTNEPWDYSALYFVFDRTQYESQLHRTNEKC